MRAESSARPRATMPRAWPWPRTFSASPPSCAWPRTRRKSKIEATKAYGAEVVLRGMIWDEANEQAKELVKERGLTYIHSVRRPRLACGSGHGRTGDPRGLAGRRCRGRADWRRWAHLRSRAGAQGSQAGREGNRRGIVRRTRDARKCARRPRGAADRVDCIIDGLRVKRVGETTLAGSAAVRRRYRDAARRRDLRRAAVGDGPLQVRHRGRRSRSRRRACGPASFRRHQARTSCAC